MPPKFAISREYRSPLRPASENHRLNRKSCQHVLDTPVYPVFGRQNRRDHINSQSCINSPSFSFIMLANRQLSSMTSALIPALG